MKALLDAIIRLKYLNSIPPELFLILLAIYAYDAFRSQRFILYVFPLHISINLYLRITQSITLNMVELLAWLMFAVWAWKKVRRWWRKEPSQASEEQTGMDRISQQIKRIGQIIRANPLNLLNPLTKEVAWKSPLAIALLVYLFSYVAYLVNSPLGEETVKQLARAAEIGITFFVLQDIIATRQDARVITTSLLASSLFVGLLAWYQRFFIQDLNAYYRHVGTLVDLALLPRIPWWYDNFVELSPVVRVGANIDPGGLSTGIYLPPVILLALLATWWATGKTFLRLWAKRLSLLALALLLAGALLFTLSRSGVYAFAGALALVILLVSPKYGKYLLLAGIGVGIVILLVAPRFTGNYALSRILSQSRDAISSSQGRLIRVEQSWAIIKRAPLLGAGYTSFGNRPSQVFPHNQFLAAFQGRGIVAFLSLLAVFVFAAWKGWKGYRAAPDRIVRGLAIWNLGVLASYFLHGLAHTPLDEIQIGATFWLALALIEGMEKTLLAERRQNEQAERDHSSAHYAL